MPSCLFRIRKQGVGKLPPDLAAHNSVTDRSGVRTSHEGAHRGTDVGRGHREVEASGKDFLSNVMRDRDEAARAQLLEPPVGSA